MACTVYDYLLLLQKMYTYAKAININVFDMYTTYGSSPYSDIILELHRLVRI